MYFLQKRFPFPFFAMSNEKKGFIFGSKIVVTTSVFSCASRSIKKN